MSRLSVLLFVAGTPTFAAGEWKENTLKPEEIKEGWVYLFDAETTFGWKASGEVKVKDGRITMGGKEKATVASSLTLTNFAFRLDLQPVWGGGKVIFDTGKAQTSVSLPRGTTRLLSYVQTGKTCASKTETDTVNGQGYIGAEVTVDAPCNIRIETDAGQTIVVHSIFLKPTDTKPLFNGKDLTGWKEFKPTKDKKVASKFTVTKEGWLNVKNGPGDLQTEGQWADFVLQFECISNGKHLNSGLFFRCVPDLYQQGYEAQIRNQWEGDDRTKPVDFGTGAIYRRQAARKVVSTDGEWFTMTVAAHGRHIATWVNGYQVTDWTDDRKESDNARNGFKKGKGALSIQGHDPTTDLSFRNIRIQSLDPK